MSTPTRIETTDDVLLVIHDRLSKLEDELSKVHDLCDAIEDMCSDYWSDEGDDDADRN